ncbi:MAG: hypothetical protein KC656_22190, partial [Myxococcales bacterium]|nr:hypothetical protein [Myxococcales bacterium]
EQNDVTIMVVEGEWDDIGSVLDTLGLTYDTVDGTVPGQAASFLTNPTLMGTYDIIFFNCGIDDGWMTQQAAVTTNIQSYVAAGGSVYASDYAYWFVEASYPSQIDFFGDDTFFGEPMLGMEGYITANVVDPSMAAIVGPTAQLNMDLGYWVVMQSATATTLVSGTFDVEDPLDWWNTLSVTGPLAVRFSVGQGDVLYTSFHNEQQSTFAMDRLLEDIVLSL